MNIFPTLSHRIEFEASSHTYRNSVGDRYISATQLIDLFVPSFEEHKEFWLYYKTLQELLGFNNTEIGKELYKAYLKDRLGWGYGNLFKNKNIEDLYLLGKREGIHELVLHSLPSKEGEWKKTNKDALVRGTKFHNEVEDLQLTEKKFRVEGKAEVVEVLGEFHGDISKITMNGIIPELRVCNHKYKIAGSIDQPYFELPEFDINDWKGLALDTAIATKEGWKTMEEIEVGDLIFDGEGELTKVEHVSEIHYNPCFEISFDTNDLLIADHEHKWIITKRNKKGVYEDFQMTTEEIANSFEKKKETLMIRCAPLDLQEVTLPLDPYVLGVYLADGNATCSSITCINQNTWKEIERRGYKLGVNHNRNIDKAECRTVLGIRKHLVELNVLNNKHIPALYLRSSYEQRLDLLRGFMDGDGYFHKKRKRCAMNTTKKWQADAFMELVSSLGWKPTYFSYNGEGFGKKVKEFEVCFTPDKNSFLTRNFDFEEVMSSVSPSRKIRSKYRYIKSIKKINTVPTKCLGVESDTHTYLAGKTLIKTHNSNKEIKKENKHQKMLYCLSHLDDCNFNHYNIQLSLYAWMLEQYGYICRNLGITHILFSNDGEASHQIYEPMKYLKKEVEQMLEYYDKNLRNGSGH